jgi:hypothetical protein
MLFLVFLGVGCTGSTEDRPSTPAVLEHIEMSEEIVCADPAARELAPFDVVEDGDWALRPVSNGAWGVGIADLDEDGWLDLLLTAGATPKLYLGSPTGLVDASDRLPPEAIARYRASIPVDVDGDGDLDLFHGGRDVDDYLLINDCTAHFTARWLQVGARTMGASFGDIDWDGDLDLAVANGTSNTEPVLFLNDGAGNYEVHDELLPVDFQKGGTFVMALLDLDGDHKLDLYRANDAGPWGPSNRVAWYRDGVFVEDDGSSGLNVDICSMGLGVGDLNGDLVPDLAISDCQDMHILESTGPVWVNTADARSFDIHPPTAHDVPWGVELVDLDNDADLDAYVAFGFLINGDWPQSTDQQDGVYLQQPDGSFLEQSAEWGILLGQSRGFMTADMNNDGWLDIIKQDWYGKPLYYRSRCGAESWLRVSLDQGGSNRFAVGSRVVVDTGSAQLARWIMAGGTSVSSGAPPEAHFGLGEVETVDIEVTWPDGTEQRWEGVPTRRQVTLHRP